MYVAYVFLDTCCNGRCHPMMCVDLWVWMLWIGRCLAVHTYASAASNGVCLAASLLTDNLFIWHLDCFCSWCDVLYRTFWNIGWIIKTSQILCSQPRQNCFGNWIEHCLHYTYCHANDVTQDVTENWEILDEEGTLLKSIYQKVTFHQSGCTIQEPISRKSWWWASEFLGIEKLIYFSLIYRKQKLTRTVTHHWDSSKIHCTMEKWLNALRKQNGQHDSAHFLLIAVTGYRSHHSHAVRRVELIGYFVLFRHQLLFCVFHCQNKSV